MKTWRTYEARRFGDVFVVEDTARRSLPPRLDLRNHSPGGYSWGCDWPGSSQLALAILCDVYDDKKAIRLYQQFKMNLIARQNRDLPLRLTLGQVMKAVEEIEATP